MSQILFSWLSIPRTIGIWIDSIAYGLIDNIYNLIEVLASASLFEEGTVLTVMNNTYVALSIFALFRIALILVNAIINPDRLTDKETGIGSVLKNLIIMFVLLIFTPMLFREAYHLQNVIVSNHYIADIFSVNGVNNSDNPGKTMQRIAISALVHPDTDAIEDGESTPAIASYDSVSETYVAGSKCSGKCEDAINDYNQYILDKQGTGDNLWSTLTRHIGRTEKVNGDTVYVYTYMFVVTFIVGVFITYVLASMAIDIAVRSVELAVLQIISPLFIVTYIDPKSAKSGPFNNWLKTVGKTYASLFIKLAVLELMIMFIGLIDNITIFDKYSGLKVFGTLAVLLAILIFAKKAPKWIGDLIGVDGETSGIGGLGKKIGSAALVGGALTKAGHAAAGIASGAIRNAHALRKAKKAGLSNERGRAHNRLVDAYKSSKDNDGKFRAAGRAFKQTYFSRSGIKKNLENAAKTSAAGGLGFLQGVSSGAKLGWNANDLKDVNAKVKADAKTNFDRYAPDYTSIPSRVGSAIGGLHEKGIEAVIGNPFDIEKRKEDAEKMQKAKDRYGKVTTNSDGSRNKLVNPVNSLEANEMVETINRVKGTKYDASSIEGLSKALVQANIDAGNISGVTIGASGITTQDGKTMSAVDFCQQNGVYTPYGKKELEVIAKESAYTKASEYVSNKQKISDANKDASTANAQMLSLLESIRASISSSGDAVNNSFNDVTESLNKQLRASRALNDAVSSGADVGTINGLKQALATANSELEAARRTASNNGVDAGLLDSYVAAASTRTEALSTVSILTAKNAEIEKEVQRSVDEVVTYKQAYGNDYKADSSFTAKDITTGGTYTFLDDPTRVEYVANLMNKATDKAKDDASKLKPKTDDNK